MRIEYIVQKIGSRAYSTKIMSWALLESIRIRNRDPGACREAYGNRKVGKIVSFVLASVVSGTQLVPKHSRVCVTHTGVLSPRWLLHEQYQCF